MTAIERAAEAMERADAKWWADPDVGHPATCLMLAEALADAGLLVTDEAQAVLAAAVAIHDGPTGGPYALHAAVDAYLHSTREASE